MKRVHLVIDHGLTPEQVNRYRVLAPLTVLSIVGGVGTEVLAGIGSLRDLLVVIALWVGFATLAGILVVAAVLLCRPVRD